MKSCDHRACAIYLTCSDASNGMSFNLEWLLEHLIGGLHCLLFSILWRHDIMNQGVTFHRDHDFGVTKHLSALMGALRQKMCFLMVITHFSQRWSRRTSGHRAINSSCSDKWNCMSFILQRHLEHLVTRLGLLYLAERVRSWYHGWGSNFW